MKIERKLLDPKFYDKKRTDKIKYIVVRTLGNITTHYHIVDGEVIQVIPDDYTTLSINGCKVSNYGYLHGICNKYNGITIGLPENVSEEDKRACLKLVMTLKQRYDIKNENIVRQMDVTGEIDPYIWHDTKKWNNDIKDKLIDISFTQTNSKE